MYGGPWKELEDTTFVDWPQYRGETTLNEVANSVLETLDIDEGDVIGGSSMGGMVALEMAVITGVSRVVLLGSAISRSEINPFIKMMAPLAKVTPLGLAQVLAGKHLGLAGEMFQKAEPGFIRAMCKAVSRWPGVNSQGKDLLRIHGTNDRVIPCPKDAHRIAGAGHLVAMTHPAECMEIIDKTL